MISVEPSNIQYVRVARAAQFGGGFPGFGGQVSGSSAGANAATQSFKQPGFGGFGGGFDANAASAGAQTQSFNVSLNLFFKDQFFFKTIFFYL